MIITPIGASHHLPILPSHPLNHSTNLLATTDAAKRRFKQACGQYSKEAWGKVLLLFRGKQYAVHQKLKQIADRKSLESGDISFIIQTIEGKNFCGSRHVLKNLLKGFSSDQILMILTTAIADNTANKRPVLRSSRWLTLMTKPQIEAIVKHINKEFIDTKHSAKRLLKALNYIEKSTAKELKKKGEKPLLLSFLKNFFTSVMSTFSLLDIGKTPSSFFETKYMLDIYLHFLMLPILMFQTVQMYLDPLKALLVVAGALTVGSLALYAYFRWFEPCPQELPYCTNLTAEAKRGGLQPVLAREEELQQLVKLLTSNSKSARRHPMIIGKPGIGKTELVKGLAQKIANGEIPALKNMQVFSINLSAIAEQTKQGFHIQAPLEQILQRLKNHKEKVILFFDDVDKVLDSETDPLSGRILDICGPPGPDSFPYCISTMKESAYTKCKRAHDRRFAPMPLKETDVLQTEMILRDLMKREAPEISISSDTLKKAIKLTDEQLKKRSQPEKAKYVVTLAIGQLKAMQKGDKLESERRQQQESKDSLIAQLNSNIIETASSRDGILNGIEKVEHEMTRIDRCVEELKGHYKRYEELMKALENGQKDVEVIAMQVLKKQNGRHQSRAEKEYLLAKYIVQPQLSASIRQYVQDHDLKVTIDSQMIAEIVEKQAALEASFPTAE